MWMFRLAGWFFNASKGWRDGLAKAVVVLRVQGFSFHKDPCTFIVHTWALKEFLYSSFRTHV